MGDTSYNVGAAHATVPKYRLFRTQPAGGAPTGTPAYNNDALNLVNNPAGGNGDPNYQAMVQQTDQLMRSANPADRYRAIVNMTKMQPQDAIPRLQAIVSTPGIDAQTAQLANEALRVMSQMAQQPQQPGAQPGAQPGMQPGAQPVQGQPQGQPIYGQVPQQAAPLPQYNPGVAAGPMSQDDANMTLQLLQPELARGGDEAVNAIRQLMALQQANPGMKEHVFNLLLNHVYHKADWSLPEAVRALGSMNDPRALPYLSAVARHPGVGEEARQAAMQVVQAAARQGNNGQPGVASTNGTSSVEYIRMMEGKLHQNGQAAVEALAEMRQALGADPRAQSPARQEIIRVLLTYIATKGETTGLMGCTQLLGEMKAREALPYLGALARNPGAGEDVRRAASATARQIMQP